MKHLTVTQVADEYVAALAGHEPRVSVALGHASERHMPDLSWQWVGERRLLAARTRERLLEAVVSAEGEDVLRRVMFERLTSEMNLHDAGFSQRLVAPLASPLHEARQALDDLPGDTPAGAVEVLRALAAYPRALREYRHRLEEAASQGHTAPRRQSELAAGQCRDWVSHNYFKHLVARCRPRPQEAQALADAAAEAERATGELGQWLQRVHAPRGSTMDAVGRETYAVTARGFLGLDLDLEQTYAQAWETLQDLTAQVHRLMGTRDELGILTAVEDLDKRTDQTLEVGPPLAAWVQERLDRAESILFDTWFSRPQPRSACHGRVIPAGGGAIYYTAPRRRGHPGKVTWSAPRGVERLPVWREISAVHHEGWPGHHLQHTVAMTAPGLHPWQRHAAHTHGYAEGWAHYAEWRSLDWGLIDDDDDAGQLSVLLARRWRAARVVIDMGLHLGLPIPPGNGFTGARSWSRNVAIEMLVTLGGLNRHMAEFEADRYLAWPGQALSFLVGAQVWEEAARAHGALGTDRAANKTFHMKALSMGPMGLGTLRSLLTSDMAAHPAS